MDPFRNYDSWLQSGIHDEYDAAMAVVEAWDEFCDSDFAGSSIPYAIAEKDHPDHAIYTAWLALRAAIDDRANRLEAEYWATYEPTCFDCDLPIEGHDHSKCPINMEPY